MPFDPQIHHRRSVRLRQYDYSRPGAYFVTVCTQNRECLFGDVGNGSVRLNEWGNVVRACWLETPRHFPNVQLDAFVVMPNHFHAIVIIHDFVGAGLPRPYKKRTLGQMVAYFKYQSTKRINRLRDSSGIRIWQRNYYERVIRNEAELNRVREYIRTNPLNWDKDEENPENGMQAKDTS